MELLIANQDKIYWPTLSRNPNAMDLLRENQDKINWWDLSSNPSIFYQSYDYDKIKKTIGDVIREPLIKTVYNPKRVERMAAKYYDDDIEAFFNTF